MEYTWYKPSIFHDHTDTWLVPKCPRKFWVGVWQVYTVHGHMKGICMLYTRYMHVIYLIYTFSISIYQAYTWYMTFWHLLGIWQVYTRWLVLWRWTWPHAARATSNHITGPCHYCNSFRFTTFAHFTFAHVSVHRPFRHKERRETPFFARIAHKVLTHTVQRQGICVVDW
jgi:hypothetical protein